MHKNEGNVLYYTVTVCLVSCSKVPNILRVARCSSWMIALFSTMTMASESLHIPNCILDSIDATTYNTYSTWWLVSLPMSVQGNVFPELRFRGGIRKQLIACLDRENCTLRPSAPPEGCPAHGSCSFPSTMSGRNNITELAKFRRGLAS